jgi:hypothetical protein
MFDGTWLFDRYTAPGTQGEWKIDETLTGLITQQQVEPIIVMGIDSNANRDVELAPRTFSAGINELLSSGRARAYLVDERSARATYEQYSSRCDRQILWLGLRVNNKNFCAGRSLRKARQ